MEVIFDLFSASFGFFVDIGNRIDFLGLNLWHISFIVFALTLIVRFLFPIVMAGSGDVSVFLSHGEADTVGDSDFYVHSGLPELGTISSYKEGSNAIE